MAAGNESGGGSKPLRPRLGGKTGVRQERVPRLSDLARTMRRAGRGGPRKASPSPRGGHPNRGKSAQDVQRPGPSARRVAVKVSLVKMNEYGRKAARTHLRYIEREGVERDGGKGVLFAAGGEVVEAGQFLEPLEGEKHQFRLIVSPEDGSELDLQEFAARFVRRMERDLGRRLHWVAAAHYNTDNPHLHLVVRGVCQEGRELRMDRRYISHAMRWRGQELATEELGPRLPLEIARQLAREVRQERLTSLDAELAKLATGHRLELRGAPASAAERTARSRHVARLQTLERLQLAHQVLPMRWELEDGWQAKLREMGARGDIIKRMHQGLRGDTSRYRVIRSPEDLPGAVVGVVREKGLHDEVAGTLYALVEAPNGEGFYVPLGRNAEHVREGAVIQVDAAVSSRATPADKTLVEVAGRGGGTYRPEAHLADLIGQGGRGGEAQEAAEAQVASIRRRLAALERLGVVTQRPGGDGWSVPADLQARLAKLDLEQPERRVRARALGPPIEQQRAIRGPTWLDKLQDAQGLAPFGFGAQLQRALVARQEFVRGLGVDPVAKDRVLKLIRLEEAELGQRLSTAGAQYVARLPKSGAWAGVVRSLPPLESGRRYVQVAQGTRFMLLRATRELLEMVDKRVEVTREQDGKLKVQLAGRGLGA